MFDWMSTEAPMSPPPAPMHAEAGIVTQGILAGTRVASNLGWRVVEALAPGDRVLTFDNGMQVIREVRREVVWREERNTPQEHWPVHVPVGALCNRVALTILPEQGVVIESDVADDALEDPFAVILSRQLVGLRGITQSPPQVQQEVITLIFEEDEVIYAEGGALIFCPTQLDLFDQAVLAGEERYKVLTEELAALVIDELRLEDALNARGILPAAIAA